MKTALFRHANGRIVSYPAHFANSAIGKNLTLVEDEIEVDKVVLEHSPNSQTRVGKKAKEPSPDEAVVVSVDSEDKE